MSFNAFYTGLLQALIINLAVGKSNRMCDSGGVVVARWDGTKIEGTACRSMIPTWIQSCYKNTSTIVQ